MSQTSVQVSNITESDICADSVENVKDSDRLPNTQPLQPQPQFKVGQRIKFQHESFDGWHKGQIIEVNYQDGYFTDVVVSWKLWNRKTNQMDDMPNYKIGNDKWIKR